MKNKLINIAFLFGSILFVFIALEALLRYTHLFGAAISWSSPDTVIGYRFKPNSRYWYFKENDHPITGKINSYGWRDKEWRLEKPENTFRIAFIGDSFVEAYQVESDKTFLYLAENELNKQSKKRFELMNFGRSDFTQTEEFIILKQDVLKFNPDMVMLFFFPGNDIADVNKETAPNRNRPFIEIKSDGQFIVDTRFADSREFKLKTTLNTIKQHSIIISLLSERYNLYKRAKNRIALADNGEKDGLPGYLSLCTSNPDPKYSQNYSINKFLIKEIANVCKQKGIKLYLVVLNTDAYIPDITNRYKTIDPTFDPLFFETDLWRYSKELDIGFIGLQSIFSDYYSRYGKELNWEHWNYDGHKLVSESLVSALSRMK